jgi:hypothetical protein
VSRADRAADRWPGRPLAHRTVRCTPDSPVNYSRTSPSNSREQQVPPSLSGAPDSPVHPDRADFGCTSQVISNPIFLFLALRHNTLVFKTMYWGLETYLYSWFCTLSIHEHKFTFKHLCWHSITKILRNGPRAHFPFTKADGSYSQASPRIDQIPISQMWIWY